MQLQVTQIVQLDMSVSDSPSIGWDLSGFAPQVLATDKGRVAGIVTPSLSGAKLNIGGEF